MVMTDPIADMLTRIRNATMSYKDEVLVPGSTVKERIAEILTREGYIASTDVEGEGKDRTITIRLKYGPNRSNGYTCSNQGIDKTVVVVDTLLVNVRFCTVWHNSRP